MELYSKDSCGTTKNRPQNEMTNAASVFQTGKKADFSNDRTVTQKEIPMDC